MLYVSLRDGSVRKYDLASTSGREVLAADLGDPSYVRRVRALALGVADARIDLPVARGFRRLRYHADISYDDDEPTSERIWIFCDDELVVSATMYLRGRVGRFRVDLERRTPRF